MKTQLLGLAAASALYIGSSDQFGLVPGVVLNNDYQWDVMTISVNGNYIADTARQFKVYWPDVGKLVITNADNIIIFPPNVSFEDEEGQRWHAEWVKD